MNNSETIHSCPPGPRRRRSAKRISAVLLMAVALHAPARAAKALRPVNFGSPTCAAMRTPLPAPVTRELAANGGQFTEKLRHLYLGEMEKSLLEAVAQKKLVLSPGFMNWLDSEQELKEELLSLYYPLDLRVFENLNTLRDHFSKANDKNKFLGANTFRDYKELMVATAVARRDIGLGNAGYGNDLWLWLAMPARYPEFFAGRDERREAMQKQRDAKAGYVCGENPLSEYLAETLKSREDFVKFAKEYDAQEKVLTERFKSLAKYLGREVHHLLVKKGYQPAKRDEYASSIEFLELLVSHQEKALADPSIDVYFPFKDAPWPALLGLGATTRPLSEARYVWEQYLGKHGERRIHDYGPYRWGSSPKAKVAIYSPSQWPDGSLQRDMEVGGVCGTMSKLARGVYLSLGKPTMSAGQDHHANLLEVDYDPSSKKYFAKIDHNTTTPAETVCGWHFADVAVLRPWFTNDRTPYQLNYNAREYTNWSEASAYAEYGLGLPLAVNDLEKEYFDTKLMVNILKNLPLDLQKKYAESLMAKACALNPYNPEPWYIRHIMADTGMGNAIALIKELRESTGLKDDFGAVTKRQNRNKAVAGKGGSHLEGRKAYVDALSFSLLKNSSIDDVKNATAREAKEIVAFIQSEKAHYRGNIYDGILMRVSSLNGGLAKMMDETEQNIREVLEPKIKFYQRMDFKRDLRNAVAVKELVKIMPEAQARRWAERISNLYTRNTQKYYVYNYATGAKPTPVWEVVSKIRKFDYKPEMKAYWSEIGEDYKKYTDEKRAAWERKNKAAQEKRRKAESKKKTSR